MFVAIKKKLWKNAGNSKTRRGGCKIKWFVMTHDEANLKPQNSTVCMARLAVYGLMYMGFVDGGKLKTYRTIQNHIRCLCQKSITNE